MAINWAAGKTKWTAHAKGEKVYPLEHLHPIQIAMEIEFQGSQKQIQLHVGFASHVFTRTPQPEDDPADIYKDERERRTFDEERYGLSHLLPDLVRSLCEGKVKCYFGKDNNFFVFRSLDKPDVEYRAFFDVDRWRERGKDAMLLIIQSAYKATLSIQAPKGRRDKPVRFKVLLTRVMQGSRPSPPP